MIEYSRQKGLIEVGKLKKRIANNRILLGLAMIIGAMFSVLALRFYLLHVENEAKEIENKADVSYKTVGVTINEQGFYVADLKSELTEYLSDHETDRITYKFEGESFYFEVLVVTNAEGEYEFEIEKISNPDFNIFARTNMRSVESVEYRTDSSFSSSVIKINQTYDHEYFAMTKDAYYILGEDIETIGFMNERFYYMSYNPKYSALEGATSCSSEVTSKIQGFKMNDYYYKYGKINFLTDYYQKFTTKTYTVKNRCDDLALKQKEETDD